MHSSLRLGAVLGLASLGLAALPAAQAQVTPTYYSGNFTQDDNIQMFMFTVTSPGNVYLYTTSYGGGSNVDGTSSNAGGFDTVLSVFDSTGTFINDNDDSIIQQVDPLTGLAYDAGLQLTLTPGTYQVALTEYDNFAKASPTYGPGGGLTNLSDGFTQQGNGNFTTGFNLNGTTYPSFVDSGGYERTSAYNLNLGNGTLAAVPEASTTISFGLLLALGLGGFAVAAKKKKAAA